MQSQEISEAVVAIVSKLGALLVLKVGADRCDSGELSASGTQLRGEKMTHFHPNCERISMSALLVNGKTHIMCVSQVPAPPCCPEGS